MKFSVVICTWNRAQSLSRLLRSLTKAEQPGGVDWEIIVVNNNCTDDTDTIIGQYRHMLPLKRVFELTPGLSHARNTGIAAASGDYIIWTDDDVTVKRNWLTSYQAAFERWPDASVFGGPIVARFEGHAPDWLETAKRLLPTVYAEINLGDTALMLDASSKALPFGANLAIRAIEQLKFRYDTRFGRRPGPSIIGFEEIDVLKRILATGKTGWWLPEPPVEHWISPSRQNIDYLRAYFHGIGKVKAISPINPSEPLSDWKRAKLYVKAIFLEILFRYHRQTSPPDKWLPVLKSSSLVWGRLAGLRQQRHTFTVDEKWESGNAKTKSSRNWA